MYQTLRQSSFIANSHNELYALYDGKKRFYVEKSAAANRG